MRAGLVRAAGAIVMVLAGGSAARAQTDRAADLAVIETGLVGRDASYTEVERANAESALAELRTRAAGLTDAEFELEVARIGALADNGHSGVLIGRWPVAFNRLAIRFLLTDDGLWVADAQPSYESLVGSRVLRVGGRDIDELRSTWARYYARSPSGQDAAIHVFLESPDLLHAAGLAAVADSVDLTLASGETVRVGTTDAWPVPRGIWSFLPMSRHLELAAAGRIEGDPLYLADPSSWFRLVELPEARTVYLQFRANHAFGGGDMRQEATQTIERLRELGPRFVIVDQRMNFGGDLNNTRALMQAIPEVVGPDGLVVAITSGRTFSAGIASLGYLKQAGGDRVTIVGAPVGDPLEFWAEGSPITLPGSGTHVGVSTERHNYMTGCPESDCHGSIRNNPIRVSTLAPDVRPEMNYVDVVEGRDPYLEAALRLLAARG